MVIWTYCCPFPSHWDVHKVLICSCATVLDQEDLLNKLRWWSISATSCKKMFGQRVALCHHPKLHQPSNSWDLSWFSHWPVSWLWTVDVIIWKWNCYSKKLKYLSNVQWFQTASHQSSNCSKMHHKAMGLNPVHCRKKMPLNSINQDVADKGESMGRGLKNLG